MKAKNSRNMGSNLDMSFIFKAKDLKSRILFTILALIIYRFGSFIPLPGINSAVLAQIASQNSEGILGMFNMLSGGSLGRMSIFALAIMPYITSSIIMQLMSVAYKPLEVLKKEHGEAGRQKINQYTRYLTVLLSMLQSYGVAVTLTGMSHGSLNAVSGDFSFFTLTTITTLTSGTIFLMWLGEQITARGIGNGTSMIIFTGIVAGLPSSIAALFELARTGAISFIILITIILIVVSLITLIVFIEKSSRKIIVQYPQRQVGNKMFGGEVSHMPLKINASGVIPPIFASSILLFPLTIMNFSNNSKESGVVSEISSYLAHGKPLYILLYSLLIIFFCFFYTSIVFNPTETAENLKKHGGFIPGRRPGKHTAEYLDYTLTRMTVFGSLYITLVCVLPEIMISKYSIPFYLGGTSLLIVVNVVIDTVTQLQSHLFSHQYESLIKKSKLRKNVV